MNLRIATFIAVILFSSTSVLANTPTVNNSMKGTVNSTLTGASQTGAQQQTIVQPGTEKIIKTKSLTTKKVLLKNNKTIVTKKTLHKKVITKKNIHNIHKPLLTDKPTTLSSSKTVIQSKKLMTTQQPLIDQPSKIRINENTIIDNPALHDD